jgi:hypothetical protein
MSDDHRPARTKRLDFEQILQAVAGTDERMVQPGFINAQERENAIREKYVEGMHH